MQGLRAWKMNWPAGKGDRTACGRTWATICVGPAKPLNGKRLTAEGTKRTAFEDSIGWGVRRGKMERGEALNQKGRKRVIAWGQRTPATV